MFDSLSLAGWTSASALKHSFIDPMCGSGTLPIEAALIACSTAPGLIRYGGATSLSDMPCPVLWKDLQCEGVTQEWLSVVKEAELRDRRRELRHSSSSDIDPAHTVSIRASDVNDASLQLARQAAVKAGVDHIIHFDHAPADQVDPLSGSSASSQFRPALIVTNPPWDVRLSEGSETAWKQLGDLARKCAVENQQQQQLQAAGKGAELSVGSTSDSEKTSTTDKEGALFVLSGNEALPPLMRLKSNSLRRKHVFSAAGIKLKLHEYRL